MPFNRLFWKFFLYLWLAQSATLAGTSAFFWYKYAKLNSIYQAQQFSASIDGLPVGDSDEQHNDPVPSARQDRERSGYMDRAPRKPRSIFPKNPLIIGTIASALFAWLLAWNFSRPVTLLRNALKDAAEGKLDVRIAPSMAKGGDELADLGYEFDRMSSQLQQLIASQRSLLHDVSHELRSPLARMQAIIGLIDQKPEEQAELLEKLGRESQRIDRLLAELLTMARLDTGILQPAQHIISAEELLLTLLDDASPQAEIANIHLQHHLLNIDRIHISGDGDMLYRALDNLLRNALKYTPENGTVTLKAEQRDTQLCISIQDTGPGIAEEELPRVLTPFYRSQQAKPITGHGLGLAIAKRMILAHGGQLRLQNCYSDDQVIGLLAEVMLPVK